VLYVAQVAEQEEQEDIEEEEKLEAAAAKSVAGKGAGGCRAEHAGCCSSTTGPNHARPAPILACSQGLSCSIELGA